MTDSDDEYPRTRTVGCALYTIENGRLVLGSHDRRVWVPERRGQAGQWREEWALVVLWSTVIQGIREGAARRPGDDYCDERERLAYGGTLACIALAMGGPEWLRDS